MSKYTTSIQNLIKNNFNLGLADYPIFDESYRKTLNQNIINYYYNYEIAFETAELFKFHLNGRMNIIMPKYNELYTAYVQSKSKLLNNVNLVETLTRDVNSDIKNEGSANSTSTSTSNSNNKEIYQETPQGKIFNTDIDNVNWATNATLNSNNISNNVEDNSTSNSSSLGSSNENYTKNITGNDGKKFNIELIEDIKNNFQSIDLLIINELDDLFFGLM